MKGYMAWGQFSRGKENIRADDSLIMLGYLDVDVEQQQKVGHLLSPMPSEMRDDPCPIHRPHLDRELLLWHSLRKSLTKPK